MGFCIFQRREVGTAKINIHPPHTQRYFSPTKRHVWQSAFSMHSGNQGTKISGLICTLVTLLQPRYHHHHQDMPGVQDGTMLSSPGKCGSRPGASSPWLTNLYPGGPEHLEPFKRPGFLDVCMTVEVN